MRRVCCVCGCDLGEKPPYDDNSVTHTYCPKCLAAAYAELDKSRPPRVRKRYPRGYWTNVDRLHDERI